MPSTRSFEISFAIDIDSDVGGDDDDERAGDNISARSMALENILSALLFCFALFFLFCLFVLLSFCLVVFLSCYLFVLLSYCLFEMSPSVQ